MSDRAAGVMPVVVKLPAEIDATNSEQVYSQLVAAFAPGVSAVVADMMSTVFCDSSGVHAIIQAYETADSRGVTMRLAVSQDTSVRRVLRLVGVDRVLPIHETLAAAVEAS